MKRKASKIIVLRLRKKYIFTVAAIILMLLAFPKTRGYISVFNISSEYKATVIIDAGHGGIDGGTSDGQGLVEKDVNLEVALRVRDILEDKGIGVVMTRTADSFKGKAKLSLNDRAKLINKSNASLFVSIHVNSFTQDPSVRGIVSFYNPHSKDGKLLAQAVAQSVDDIVYSQYLKSTMVSRVCPEDFYLLRETDKVGIVFEMGFITNPKDRELLMSKEYKKQVALAISDGIIRYLKSH